MRFKILILLSLLLISIIPIANYSSAEEIRYNVYVVPVYFPDFEYYFEIDDYLLEPLYEIVDQYIPEVSYDRATVNFNYYPEWIELDKNYSYYIDRPKELVEDALAKLPEDERDYVLSADEIMVIHAGDDRYLSELPEDMYSAASSGKVKLSTPFGRITAGWAVISETDLDDYCLSLITHFFLKALGLPELISDGKDLAGAWDPMSSLALKDCDYYPYPTHINAIFKKQLGWLEEDEVLRVSTGNVTVDLVGSCLTEEGIKLIEVPISSKASYYLEARVMEGYDTDIPEEGVLIWYRGPEGLKLIDYNSDTPELDDACLTEGDTFKDEVRGLIVKVLSYEVGRYFKVEIQYSPGVIIDKTIYPAKRLNLGEEAEIFFHAVRSLDRSPAYGFTAVVNGRRLVFNETGWIKLNVTRTEPGVMSVGIDEVLYEGEPIPFSMEADTPTLYWDRIVVEAITLDRTIGDVGYSPTVTVYVYYESDHTPLVNGSVYVNGIPLTYNETIGAWQGKMPAKYEVGYEVYSIIKIEDYEYGITSVLMPITSLTFYWDRVRVELEDWHGDLSSPARITANAYYELSKKPFNGLIEINGTKAEKIEPGLFSISVPSIGEVGSVTLTVTKIEDYEYGITSFSSTSAKAIWDAVKVVDISSSAERVDVGKSVEIKAKLVTLYGNEPYEGEVEINGMKATPLGNGGYYVKYSLDQPKSIDFKVTSISGGLYGLRTLVNQPSVKVTWDRVRVTLSTPKPKLSVGENATIVVKAIYESDGSPFLGSVKLNLPTVQDKAGTYEYKVESIEDPVYGITAFVSNTVKITFDKPSFSISVSNPSPGVVEVTATLTYEVSGEPIRGEEVIVNGLKASEVSPGVYKVSISTWSPSIDVKAEAPNLALTSSTSASLQMNLTVLILPIVALIAIIGVVVAVRKRKQ